MVRGGKKAEGSGEREGARDREEEYHVSEKAGFMAEMRKRVIRM